jgi:hypothetical protein
MGLNIIHKKWKCLKAIAKNYSLGIKLTNLGIYRSKNRKRQIR